MPTSTMPVAVDARAPGEHQQQHAGDQRAEQRRQGDAEAAEHAGAARRPAEDDRRDRTDRGALGDAEDVGGGQRVAGEGLEQCAGDPEGQADERADDDPGRPQLQDDELLGVLAEPDQGAQDVGQADREVAAAEADRAEQDDGDGGAERHDHLPPAHPAGDRPDADDGLPGLANAVRGLRRAACELGHVLASRRRRISAMKNGAPISASHDADLELAGADDDPADDVGEQQQRGPEQAGAGDQPAVRRAGEGADDVRYDQADEGDGPAGPPSPRRRAA
jgi:hypothetical protein